MMTTALVSIISRVITSQQFFLYNDLNLSHIESVPLPDQQWEYRFYIDISGNLHDPAVQNALQGVRTEVADFKILGNY